MSGQNIGQLQDILLVPRFFLVFLIHQRIELPLDILRSHARKQRIQQVFKSPITNDPTFSSAPVASVSSSSHDIVALSDPSTSSSVSSNTRDITPNNQSEEPAVVDHSMQLNDSSEEPAIVDHGMRLETLEEELNIRIAALQDADSRLDFVQQPSSEKSFIFPDPETILKVNCGPFALSSTYPRNRRFLETEARLCFLLRELHQDHVRSNPADWERMEDLLYSALEKLHRMKGREWELQASSGLTQYIVHNHESHPFSSTRFDQDSYKESQARNTHVSWAKYCTADTQGHSHCH
ncbi:hypothetical protein C8J55DRAFT_485268 [Lentinula edodes]|uniref:Uncharacterized protein n=1 Tax=Lentinula lateritia TaxID=40482 RepID=A0A9W9AZG3_9AGAR|nr:hypothetical protein C8J55DRAFT_485268 [Lentinula edodes]